MATNTIDNLPIDCPIRASPDKHYNFFKLTMSDLLNIAPLIFKGVQLIEGEEGKVGCVKQWKYALGGIELGAKVMLEAFDDAAKKITYTVLEGDLLLLYKSFAVTFEFIPGTAKCNFAYEKRTLLSPPPEAYVPLLVTALTLVDQHLL